MTAKARRAGHIWLAVGLAAATLSIGLSPDFSGALGAVLALLMAGIGRVDASRFRIPDPLNAASFLVGCGNALATGSGMDLAALGQALARAAVTALIFYGLKLFYERRRGLDAIGLGDVKLAAVAGVWLGPIPLSIAIECAAVTALLGALRRSQTRGRRLGRRGRVPFGAYFAPSIWLAWMLQTVTGW